MRRVRRESPCSNDSARTPRQIISSGMPIDRSQMKLIGLLTEDPKTYFEVLETLREEKVKFVSLDFSEPVPANVGGTITTRKELAKVYFDRVVPDHNAQARLKRA